MKWIDGGITAPKGFRASGVAAGIKKKPGKKDCALIVSDSPAVLAGVFTKNVMKSPPVFWNIECCKAGKGRGVFINAGNANAATGTRGDQDVRTTAEDLASKLGVSIDDICICSTGVIGVPLPMEKIGAGVAESVKALSANGSLDAATAIMTTDLVAKEFAAEVALSGGTVRLGAIAKGSGMISPNMATMIAIITCDAAIDAAELRGILVRATELSFNQISVDNDMSTSDTVLVYANGQSGAAALTSQSADFALFESAFTEFCQAIAKSLVKDGEGATKFVEIRVAGTATDADAKSIARAIGNSQLCKTAFFGEDANWGRFACAAGYAGVDFDPKDLSIALDGVVLTSGGLVADYPEQDAAAVMKQKEFTIRVSVGGGPGKATFWTCDLSQGYVSINADYRS